MGLLPPFRPQSVLLRPRLLHPRRRLPHLLEPYPIWCNFIADPKPFLQGGAGSLVMHDKSLRRAWKHAEISPFWRFLQLVRSSTRIRNIFASGPARWFLPTNSWPANNSGKMTSSVAVNFCQVRGVIGKPALKCVTTLMQFSGSGKMLECPAEFSSSASRSRCTLDVCQTRIIDFVVTPAFRMISAISLAVRFSGHSFGLSVP